MLPIIDTEGQVALVDYTIGDTVGVPTAFAASGSERIAAITLTESEDGSYEVTLEFATSRRPRSYGGDTSGQDAAAAPVAPATSLARAAAEVVARRPW